MVDVAAMIVQYHIGPLTGAAPAEGVQVYSVFVLYPMGNTRMVSWMSVQQRYLTAQRG